MKLSAQNLPGTNNCLCFAANNPYFEIYRGSHKDNDQFYKVYSSDQAVNTTNPIYDPLKLTGQ